VVGRRVALDYHWSLESLGLALPNFSIAGILYLGGSAIWTLLQSTASPGTCFVHWYDSFCIGVAKPEYFTWNIQSGTTSPRATGISDSPARAKSSTLEVGLSNQLKF
jgi:hypothetical protein